MIAHLADFSRSCRQCSTGNKKIKIQINEIVEDKLQRIYCKYQALKDQLTGKTRLETTANSQTSRNLCSQMRPVFSLAHPPAHSPGSHGLSGTSNGQFHKEFKFYQSLGEKYEEYLKVKGEVCQPSGNNVCQHLMPTSHFWDCTSLPFSIQTQSLLSNHVQV
jgi:carbonic anhydrase